MMFALEIARRLLGSKIALGALVCLALVVGVNFYGEMRWRAGYEAYRLEMLEAAAEAERNRIEDDARLKDLSLPDLCADYLGSRGMPVEDCEQLRGLPVE
ncbi:hypothetical protein [Roseibium album]|uniref:hypothetical protein n=1 Tax=Roseibium album TaxID=311410 RepID=UPI0024914A1C|nr:hypothetical protein [Roseibium album]